MITVVVDAANVMGSRPDGWWRDRAGAAVRLDEDLARLAGQVVAVPGLSGEAEVGFLLVLEGAARAAQDRLPKTGNVEVIAASGSGDDAIVSAVRELTGRCVVVTADRELRRRCEALGAAIVGPGWLLTEFRSH